MSDVQNTESLKILLCQTMQIILNIIIISITLLLINYNIIVTAITNFWQYFAKYACHAEKLSQSDSCFLERELPLMDRFSFCLNNCLLTHTQLSITDSMDTVKISQRFACANEQSK